MSKIQDKIQNMIINTRSALDKRNRQRDDSIVLIGAWFGEKFADNSRYLFQYLADNKKALGLSHVVWVSRSKSVVEMIRAMGYEAYEMYSEESIKYHKIAKYHVICNSYGDSNEHKADILPQYSWGAKKINLWHGVIGFKAVAMASPEYELNRQRHKILYFLKELFHKNAAFRQFVEQLGGWGDCYFLSTTAYRTDTLTKYFRLPRDHYIETGFARVAGSVRLLPIEEQIISIIKSYKYRILYLPTFRGKDSAFDFNNAASGIKDYLECKNVLWVQKFHSASHQRTENLVHEGNVLSLPHDFDINTIIPLASIIVTDYSSVTGDAVYYYKPLIYYVPDFEEYNCEGKGFVISPDEIMCGPKAFNSKELEGFIEGFLNNGFSPDEKYLTIRNCYYDSDKTLGDIWEDIKKNAR